MASPRRDPPPRDPPPAPAPAPAPASVPAPAPAPSGEAVAITIKTDRTNKLPKDSPPNSVREQAQRIDKLEKQRSVEKERPDDQCYVRNSSFLSRDIEAQKARVETFAVESPPKTASPPKKVMPPPRKQSSLQKREPSPPREEPSPPRRVPPPPLKDVSPPKNEVAAPAVSAVRVMRSDSKVEENSVAMKASKIEAASPPKKEVTSPPVSAFKINKTGSKDEEIATKVVRRENSIGKEAPAKTEKLSLVADDDGATYNRNTTGDGANSNTNKTNEGDKNTANEESNGVGDKIKKFERAAEDASSTVGKLSRPGSVRGRSRVERLGSDGKDDFPPPATPFKDNVHFELGPVDRVEPVNYPVERQQSLTKNVSPNLASTKWQRSESHEEKSIQKPEPQKIIKPEFKPMPSPVDVTIRSPSLGAKIPDQFPSHGTAFRNVASPDQARTNVHKFNDDVNTQNNFKACKLKTKEKYSVSKGSSYFTRGSEEIWLVKKKDIEEIEERVLDSFRRAGGNICMRSESMRPSSDSGQSVSFSHATMGRNKRQMYARSESLDPQWAGARAQTLKRQTSVACTCGHDKKSRAKSAGAGSGPAASAEPAPRPRSRSHGDDNTQPHVLDKYETLV